MSRSRSVREASLAMGATRFQTILRVVLPALTGLLYASDRTVDQEERRRLLAAAQQRVAELAVEIPLYNVTRLDAVPASLRGFKGNPTNAGIFWNVHEWNVR